MTYNTLYQWHRADLYIYHTRFYRLYCTSVKRDIKCGRLHSNKPYLSISHSVLLWSMKG